MKHKEILAIFYEALKAGSLIEFVQAMRSNGLDFMVNGRNPVIACRGGCRMRLRTHKLMKPFFRRLSVWDRRTYGSDATQVEIHVLGLRLLWMELNGYANDVPNNAIEPIEQYMALVGKERMNDAARIIHKRMQGASNEDTALHFCSMCWK